jgi:polysaccharide deacetylase family protein (PEP-CTERM system associated)
MGGAPPNVLSFDVEDWYQLACRRVLRARVAVSPHVVAETGRVLDQLGRRGVRATFFVVARVAEAHPGLVRRIHDEGHEVASHGYDHRRVDAMGREAFAADLARSLDVLEDVTGAPVAGFRAPEFSFGPRCGWAFEELARAGLRYDSSVVPCGGRRYGTAGAPRRPFPVATTAGPLMELPIATARLAGCDVPAGGGYLRLLPHEAVCSAVGRLNAGGGPAVLFLHPYELAAGRLSLAGAPGAGRSRLAVAAWACRRNLRRRGAAGRLDRLLEALPFGRAGDALDRLAPAPA